MNLISELRQSITEKLNIYQGINQIKKNNFWFIDIPRTSSSSIKIELSNVYGSNYGKINLLDKRYGKKSVFKDHLTAQEAQLIFGKKIWDKLFTFTIVRNPWDRMASLYFYRQKKGQLPTGLSFKDYIMEFKRPRYKLAKSTHSYSAYYYGIAEYILDRKDNIMVDFIGRYENREADLKVIAEKIGCPSLGNLHLQKAKLSDLHYSECYDDMTKNIIEEVFAKDIELFGYQF